MWASTVGEREGSREGSYASKRTRMFRAAGPVRCDNDQAIGHLRGPDRRLGRPGSGSQDQQSHADEDSSESACQPQKRPEYTGEVSAPAEIVSVPRAGTVL